MSRFKSGYVGIIGLPNTGKSTLLNKLTGRKIAITTPKPQTTRTRIPGIVNGENYQIVFVDTPGVQKRSGVLYSFMADLVEKTMKDVDLVLHLIDGTSLPSPSDEEICESIKKLNKPALLAINKIDKIKKSRVLPLIDHFNKFSAYFHIVPISALTGENMDELIKCILELLPEGERLFPEDVIAGVTERFIAGEIIREKIINNTGEEIPYSTAVTVEEFKERDDGIYIRANIHVEKNSQKGILIGKDGSMIKKIGILAREDLEQNFGKKVYLDLWVCVTKNWTRSSRFLRETMGS